MKQKIVLIIAVGMGALAFVLNYSYLKNKQEELYKNATTVAVLAAAEDLPAGAELNSRNLQTIEVYETGLGEEVLRNDKRQVVLGKTLKYPLRKGTQLTWIHVDANLNEVGGLASTIRSGMRAMSIPVSSDGAVSGLVRPNDKVDILGTFSFVDEDNPSEMETVTFTVLQDATVLATGQETARAELEISANNRRRGSYNAVTIAVFPEEAELLAFATNVKGTLTLTLRNPNDVSVMEQTPPIDFQTLQRELPRLNEKRQSTLHGQDNFEPLRR